MVLARIEGASLVACRVDYPAIYAHQETAVTDADHPIRQLLAGYQAAVLAKDVDAFVSLYADDVLIYELWGHWTHDLASWRAMAKGWFEFLGDERSVVEAANVQTTMSGDMALLTAFLTYRAVDASGKALRSLDNRLSWVARQRGGRWQVVHEHTSVPISHETGKGLFTKP
jgi:uncharacterized protein (TIGR02246 family)